jgi:hypothetical protein
LRTFAYISLDREHDPVSVTRERSTACLRSCCRRCSSRGIHVCRLSRSRRLTFGRGLFRPSSVRFTGHRRLHRVFLLAASASGSHDLAMGRRIPAYLSFLLPKPDAGVQHIRDIAPRAHCMERKPSNQSMKPTAPFHCDFSVFATTPCRGLSLSR